jgi:ribonuclease HI
MKTLKLNNATAQLVASGQKTSTWRLYDDKDISVDDEIQFIDRVDPHDRNTWYPIGVGTVDSVLHKRLGSVSPEDLKSEGFESQDAMLAAFTEHYGKQISLETPVKIIHFTFQAVPHTDQIDEPKQASDKEIKLFADGGSRGNPGPSASGFVLMDMQNKIFHKAGIYLGITTNNQAEYLALKLGLEEALKQQIRVVHVHLDSLLVVNQMLGKFKVKNRDLWPIHAAIKELLPQFEKVTFVHVPRALNKDADAMVNEALDKEAKNNLQTPEVV